MPVFFVYIIYSPIIDQYYVGHTDDLSDRFFRHINSGSKATKKVNDWQLVYKEMYENRSEAYRREMEIKKKKSRKYIERLIVSVG
jgi:putative endonuclease